MHRAWGIGPRAGRRMWKWECGMRNGSSDKAELWCGRHAEENVKDIARRAGSRGRKVLEFGSGDVEFGGNGNTA